MKKINISTQMHPNTFALVDDCDYDRLNKHKWHAVKDCYVFYAKRSDCSIATHPTVPMHREIMQATKGETVDHKDQDGLNNQRSNLRKCSTSENLMNRKKGTNNTSGYKGVHWCTQSNRWRITIYLNRKKINLGYHTCLIKAAKMYDEGAVKYHGEFARLNFERKEV